jgi:hypothetical protein
MREVCTSSVREAAVGSAQGTATCSSSLPGCSHGSDTLSGHCPCQCHRQLPRFNLRKLRLNRIFVGPSLQVAIVGDIGGDACQVSREHAGREVMHVRRTLLPPPRLLERMIHSHPAYAPNSFLCPKWTYANSGDRRVGQQGAYELTRLISSHEKLSWFISTVSQHFVAVRSTIMLVVFYYDKRL